MLTACAGPKAVEHLRGMRDRVQQIGGVLGIESSRGKGTTIRVTVPDPQPEIEHGREQPLRT